MLLGLWNWGSIGWNVSLLGSVLCGKTDRRWQGITKLDLKESWCDGCDGVQWICLVQQC
jgi:hypothetical protein